MMLERKIEVMHIEPGKPVQNAHVESFHGKLRDECLNASWFQNLFDARRKIAAWREEYNEERPHSSLGYRTPAAFAREIGGEKGCGKDAARKPKAGFPLRLEIPQKARDFHFPTASATAISLHPGRGLRHKTDRQTRRTSYDLVRGARGQNSRTSRA